ncbi:MAG TPA: PAS domain-containing protein, partial [Mucilaginibacter sp.]
MIKKQRSFEGEAKRLKALSAYNVLDTLPEKEYDAITRLASYICQAPIALITLIDSERQWFKSKVGIEICEIPRIDAFCNHTILHDDIMEINNASEDEAFKDNIFVRGEAHIRFYAGAPLIDPEGHKLGSLCVIDTIPRKLSLEQRDALRTLASEVMSHLILKKQKQELEASLKKHKEFYNLFNSSSEIQIIASDDSSIELINNAVINILGYEPEQVMGKSLWEFVVDKNREQYVPLIEKAVANEQPFEIETQTVTLDNEVRWIGWCAIHKAGKWYASGRDITYQKKILADLEQLSLVASKMINGVTISNADDKIVWINDAFKYITGFDNKDVENKRLRDVMKGDAGEFNSIDEYNELIKTKKSYASQVYATCKDGRQIWLSIVNSVVYNER